MILLFVCSCGILLLFANGLIRTCSTFSHAAFSCFFSCFIRICTSVLSWFNYFLITWISFDRGRLMFLYLSRCHWFFFSILCKGIFISTAFSCSSTFFKSSFLFVSGIRRNTIFGTHYFIFGTHYFIFDLIFNFTH